MDLIFADENRKDIGVLHDFKFDLAYGEDENDFELTVTLENNQCKEGYILYIDGTEYGGIIDSISPDSTNNSLIYNGRTWHGILNSKVIEPDEGNDYRLVNGEANSVIGELLTAMDLNDIFIASEEESGINVINYQFRYDLGYFGIMKMLSSHNAKLKMKWQDGKVKLWSTIIDDYSINEEFDTSQMSFSIKKNFNLCNHLICLGQGDLKDRHVIHLFTNEYGGIQPYSNVEQPLQDSDYILDKSQQLLFGKDEYAQVYDYSSAEQVINYVPMQEEPSDWLKNYTSYFELKSGKYENIEQNLQDVYRLQTVEPSDWGKNYKNYFYLKDGEYKNIEFESVETYHLTESKPSDWDSNYSEYFTRDGTAKAVEPVTKESYWRQRTKPSDWLKTYSEFYVTDGVSYSQLSGDSVDEYVKQTSKPSNWDSGGWKEAYIIGGGKFVQVGVVNTHTILLQHNHKWMPNKFYNKTSKTVAPKWGSVDVYRKDEEKVAPNWVANKYYRKEVKEFPTWTSERYYTLNKDEDVGVIFVPGKYFKEVYDNYASLVEGAISRFEEIYSSDELDISFDAKKKYDIGDIVGATDNVTGIFVSQPIIKKIVTISKDNESIEYEVKKYGS